MTAPPDGARTRPRAGGWRRPAETATNRPVEPPARELLARPKRIVICADGTWNTPSQRSGSEPAPTNVWLLYQRVPHLADDGRLQLAYYHPGVGTGGPLDRLLGGLCGLGIGRNIRDCYRFIVDNYAPGDAIYLFGFSRGAYTVRSLAGLIRNCGIVDRARCRDASDVDRTIGAAYKHYRSRADATAPAAELSVDFRARHSHPLQPLTCIGVWDTVGSLGIPIGLLGRLTQVLWFGFHDVTLSSWVRRAFHAVAVDERRRPFEPTLWNQQPGAAAAGQHLEQVWFAGVHSDVGGGYREDQRGLADLTLRWMTERVSSWCGLRLAPEAAGHASPAVVVHDSWKWYYLVWRTRVIDGGLRPGGWRDTLRQTAETVSDSVRDLVGRYRSSPMPGRGGRYDPANLRDYDRRVEAARRAPPQAPVNAWDDIRTPRA